MSNNTIYFNSNTSIITPDKPVVLSGYINRNEPYLKVADELEINTLILKNDTHEIRFNSVDCLYIDKNLITATNQDQNTNCQFVNLSGASHSHFAPSLDKSKPALGIVDDAFYEITKKIANNNIIEARNNKVVLSTIEYYTANIELSINRRRKLILYKRNPFKWKSKIINSPNYFGKVDKQIHIIVFKNNEGIIKAITWSFACHPTTWPNINEVSSDFIGAVRLNLRTIFGKIPIIFFQGFSGNIRAKKEPIKWSFKEILYLPPRDQEPFSKDEFYNWSNKISESIIDSIKNSDPEIHKPLLFCKEYSIPLSELINGTIPDISNLTIKIIEISKSLLIIAFSAEPVVEYVDILKKIFIGKTIVTIGCTVDTFGYLPTNKMVKEGGYEGGDFFKIFGYECSFKKNIEEVIIRALRK